MSDVLDPKAYAYSVARNREIDEWRHLQAEARRRKAWPIYVAQKRLWYRYCLDLRNARAYAVALLEGCPRNGAVELADYYRDGTFPPSHDPRRKAWDKRIQRARAWLFARLDAEQCRLLARGRGVEPTEPTLYQVLCTLRAEGL